MPPPRVTVITPSFNQGPFIRTTIESVLGQGYSNLEYIIMDGGSTDETASVVKDYSSRLTWISEKDRGQSHAINKGFQMAGGEIVAWLNSDDIYLPGAIERAVGELASNRQFGAVYGEGYLIDREGSITGRFPSTEPFNLWKLVHLSDYILQQTVFFRRNIFDEVGFVGEDLHYCMDWELLIRIGKRYPLGYIPEYLACLREYPEAKSFSGGARRIQEIKRMLQSHTGRRLPPGYVVYGLDTYRKIWCEAIQSHTPRLLNRPSRVVQSAVDLASLYLIGHRIRYSQGWYEGWAGSRVRLMLPARTSRVVIRGFNPRRSNGLSLEVRTDGQSLDNQKVSAGNFEMRVEFPGRDTERNLELIARGMPCRSGKDRMRAYYRLDRVEPVIEPPANAPVQSTSAVEAF